MARRDKFPLSLPQMDAKELVEEVNFSSSEAGSDNEDASSSSSGSIYENAWYDGSDAEAERYRIKEARRKAEKSRKAKAAAAGNKRKRSLTWAEKCRRGNEIDASLKQDEKMLAPLKERGRRRARPDDFDSSDEEAKKRARLRDPAKRSTTPERPVWAMERSMSESWFHQSRRKRSLRPGETQEQRAERLEREKGMSSFKLQKEDALAHIKWNFGSKLGDEGLAGVEKLMKERPLFAEMYEIAPGLKRKQLYLYKQGIFEGQPVTKEDLKKIPSPPLKGENIVKDRVGGWLAAVEVEA